jgi:hypothetical protein
MHSLSTRPHRCTRAALHLAFAVIITLPSLLSAQPARKAVRPAPAFTATQLTALPTDGWLTNGGNLYNQRYSPLSLINRDNVANLKPNWRVSLNGSGSGSKYSGQGQPLVYDGVIYMVTGADDVYAVDVDTGEMLWTYEAKLDDTIDTICCGCSSRGLALGDGRIYVGQLDGKVVALDQRTGKVAWSIQAERWQNGFPITSAPLYFDGLVITGFAGGDRATRGRLKAFDAKSGALKWTFYTIPGPGDFGHDTWPQDNDGGRLPRVHLRVDGQLQRSSRVARRRTASDTSLPARPESTRLNGRKLDFQGIR